jgi:hypothetical protein
MLLFKCLINGDALVKIVYDVALDPGAELLLAHFHSWKKYARPAGR